MIRGQMTKFNPTWVNLGCAPPYRNWYPAVRIDDGLGHSAVFRARDSARAWIPGMHYTVIEAPLSQTLPPGKYTVYAGIIDAATGKPAIRLANEGRDAEGWYPVSSIQRY